MAHSKGLTSTEISKHIVTLLRKGYFIHSMSDVSSLEWKHKPRLERISCEEPGTLMLRKNVSRQDGAVSLNKAVSKKIFGKKQTRHAVSVVGTNCTTRGNVRGLRGKINESSMMQLRTTIIRTGPLFYDMWSRKKD